MGKVRSETNIIKKWMKFEKNKKIYNSQILNCIGNFFLLSFQKKLQRVMGDLVKLTLLFETIEKMSDFDHFKRGTKNYQ